MIDRHALIGFGFVAISVLAVKMIHAFVSLGRLPSAILIQRIFRWVFVPAYFATLFLCLTL